VVNSGVYATEEVATHAVTLGLALVRRVMVGDRAVRAGAWPAPADLGRLRRLSTLRVGILGYGRIGRMTADAYRALGCIVTVHAPSRADEARSAGFDVTATPDALLRGSDILSIHVGLTEATRGMIGRRELGLLPEGAVVVNTGRGAVIDEEALVAALESGRLAGAGLDVFAAEPLPLDHPLRTHPNAVVTPHTAYYSEESLQACREHTVTSLLDALAGRQPRTLVNDVVISSMADTSRR
jgi:D-3-phosphoglycerate dehydrogenase